jgi:Flp pilus assembly pilin Flp
VRLRLLKHWLSAKLAPERGANLVEYLLLVSLIAIAVMATIVLFGGVVGRSFGDAGSQLSTLP